MAINRCNKGHIYDSDLYSSCPTCSSEGYRIDFGQTTGPRTEAIFPGAGAGLSAQDVGKTIGFGSTVPAEPEEVGKTMAVGLGNVAVSKDSAARPVTGWLVCIKGINAGKAFDIHSDYNYVGRESGDIVIPGDSKISKEKHMMITYDPQDRLFYISPAAGANIIRLNGKALFGAAQLQNYDVIETGDSKFVFMGFCSEKFDWSEV